MVCSVMMLRPAVDGPLPSPYGYLRLRFFRELRCGWLRVGGLGGALGGGASSPAPLAAVAGVLEADFFSRSRLRLASNAGVPGVGLFRMT